jgi:3',5'-nucleoside bisphosphate phosphatase
MSVSSFPPDALVDLHAHTTASDGTATPTELVHTAKAANLSLLAVTDHDTTAGVAEAQAAARDLGIRLMPGVELSTRGNPGSCHLLGLGIDPTHAELNETLARLSEARRARNALICERLTALGIPVTLAEVTAIAPPGANVGRPHFAQWLIQNGVVKTNEEAFQRYLADGASAYLPKDDLSPAEAIALVHKAGGLCFVAHPGLLKLAAHETEETRIRAYAELGLDGIEAYYSNHTPAQTERFLRLATKRNLLVTGGSDFHGANRPTAPLGIVREGQPLPASLLPERLLALAS